MTPPRGYADPAYAATLVDLGAPRPLARCGGTLVVRPTPDGTHADAAGPYPLFACRDWHGLAADLDDCAADLVSVVLVTDPLGAYDGDLLRATFPEVCRAFKEHQVVDLRSDHVAARPAHHRRNVRRARAAVEVETLADPVAFLDEWVVLYDELVTRHAIRGPARFSRASFARQLALPDLILHRAHVGGRTVAAGLWLDAGDVVSYHLGATSPEGYAAGASFALFDHALTHHADAGAHWADLGAGAGAVDDPADGLARFKRGWATGTRTAWLCGRVLQPERYAALCQGVPDAATWFPGYRAGDA